MVELDLGWLNFNKTKHTIVCSYDNNIYSDGSEHDAFDNDIADTQETNVVEYNYVGNHEFLEELQDNGLDTFVKHEGPNQFLNMLLEEQAENIIFGQIYDSKDYED